MLANPAPLHTAVSSSGQRGQWFHLTCLLVALGVRWVDVCGRHCVQGCWAPVCGARLSRSTPPIGGQSLGLVLEKARAWHLSCPSLSLSLRPSLRRAVPLSCRALGSHCHPRACVLSSVIVILPFFLGLFLFEFHTEQREPCLASASLIYSSLFYDFVLKTIGLGCNNTDVFASQENREFPLLSPR